ncbi:MAG: hypothetical protein FWD33_02660 [Alphaproteobacteria bacterium]|nr:hypothetical protein [Alphaproteobacteria bacterium]
MEPAKILQGFKDVADTQALLHEEAMMCAHRENLNGVKRLHRHLAKTFQHHGICLLNFGMDFGFYEMKKPDVKKGFDAKNLKDHLNKMVPRLEQDIEKLKKLNGDFIKFYGMPCPEGIQMQDCLVRKWAKIKFRWIPRFEFTKWDPLDIVQWDKWLHDKIRDEHDGGK